MEGACAIADTLHGNTSSSIAHVSAELDAIAEAARALDGVWGTLLSTTAQRSSRRRAKGP